MPSVVYALRRDEVWHCYKKAWLRSLWPFHVFVLTMPLGFICLLRQEVSFSSVVEGLLFGLLACGFMVAYPQLRYRSDTRTLVLDDRGIRAVRGKTDYFVEWAKIARLDDDGDYLIITARKRNAFIVPARAFASKREQLVFRTYADARIYQD